MNYIHNYPNWTAFTYDELTVNLRLEQLHRAVGYLTGRLASLGFETDPLLLDTLAQDVIQSSEIEGVVLNSDQVRSSVARRLGLQIPSAVDSSHYIDGIVDVMLDAATNVELLTEKRLFGWHAALFPMGYSGQFPIRVGGYRETEMQVVSGAFGREKVHYVAPEPARIEAEMQQFLTWFNDETQRPTYLKSAIAHLWFVCIHPFEDGNGRLARAISDLAITQAEGGAKRFFSVSRQINTEKKHYYQVLERVQKSNHDITEWLDWYLGCVERAVQTSCGLLDQVIRKSVFWQKHAGVSISERQKQVLNYYLDGYEGHLTVKNWAKIAKCSVDTAARDVADLVQKNLLAPEENKQRNVAYQIL